MTKINEPLVKRSNWLSKGLASLAKSKGRPLSGFEIKSIINRIGRRSPDISRVVYDPIGTYRSGKNAARLIASLQPNDLQRISLRDFAKKYGTDFIFKGGTSKRSMNSLAGHMGESTWWTKNPYVAAGYAAHSATDPTRSILAVPNSGFVRRATHIGQTPHIASSSAADIARANFDAKRGAIRFGRHADTPASQAADYEYVMSPEMWRRVRNRSLPLYPDFDRSIISRLRHDGNFPVVHGIEGTLFDRNSRFVVPSARAVRMMDKYPVQPKELKRIMHLFQRADGH